MFDLRDHSSLETVTVAIVPGIELLREFLCYMAMRHDLVTATAIVRISTSSRTGYGADLPTRALG